MLISFKVKNFRSIKDELVFSMERTKEKQMKERLAHVEKYNIDLLPAASIYGGNASGKSNFIKAVRFAQWLIVKGTQIDDSIPTEPFLLGQASPSKPSEFTFVILVNEKIYEYGFKVTKTHIVEEWLTEVLKTTEKKIFTRQNRNIELLNSYTASLLQFAAQGTRDNQLLLTNSVSQNVKDFEDIYHWFSRNLVILDPNSIFSSFNTLADSKMPMHDLINANLQCLDTGVSRLGEKEVDFETLDIPADVRQHILRLPINGIINLDLNGNKYYFSNNEIGLKAVKVITYHKNDNGEERVIDFANESDGTKRVIDLLPLFIEATQTNATKVFLIDELDRSLHTMLINNLINSYLESCNKDSRTQLIFTTHDLMLMSQHIFRRDEMWVMERDSEQSTQLYSISDYDLRNDKDIRKSYLQGRFGGIPKILLANLNNNSTESQGA